ncbi:PREDICTED: anthocyanidin 3-O-glucosyltransferase 6-like isoform X2 [Erythranthe guttata]|uniref:anthocyanidin 3-O-glucosyltransferase 6-like isoform X2 n=1 Tax=Erythranthe guttata TaxID=4155 RepID=UPI00064D852B|nr:PREDICTED: anthocyanidin 3-O-glucosyltransferase 6-like isoform X2 [Erythranthe guttata]|eukprot:XP_012830919.1 PREDICTED: anthocyanidin 3-O-glucosyltransferase 6-like isoform X2 [Erythranthe guttata]
MEKTELVFIPSPGLSHLIATVEMAKLLLDRDHRLSITVLIMKSPNNTAVANYTDKISSPPPDSSNTTSFRRPRFINLPGEEETTTPTTTSSSETFIFDFIDSHSTHIRKIISDIIAGQRQQPSTSRLGGLVLDMFCTKFADIADEFNIPAYVFFTSGACSLGFFRHLASLKFDQGQDLTQYKDSDTELSVPCFSVPVPAKVFPATLVKEGPMADVFLDRFRRLKDTKGIMVNTFHDLESYAVDSLQSGGKSQTPRIYPIGPVWNLYKYNSVDDDVSNWLDEQPEKSVVFLCFGTMGSFDESQVREIATALEKSGARFLWSLRKPGAKGSKRQPPTEYESFEEVLPEGFTERTKGIGRVIGWAPQVAVLSHPAVGGFVSHCGWNSILESVSLGVPIATFPMYAEQQLNAFQLVKELGMAEEIRINYKIDFKGDSPPEIVAAADIEVAIRRLMTAEEEGGGGGVRGKVKEMQSKSRAALLEGGSSYKALSLFIEDVISNAI